MSKETQIRFHFFPQKLIKNWTENNEYITSQSNFKEFKKEKMLIKDVLCVDFKLDRKDASISTIWEQEKFIEKKTTNIEKGLFDIEKKFTGKTIVNFIPTDDEFQSIKFQILRADSSIKNIETFNFVDKNIKKGLLINYLIRRNHTLYKFLWNYDIGMHQTPWRDKETYMNFPEEERKIIDSISLHEKTFGEYIVKTRENDDIYSHLKKESEINYLSSFFSNGSTHENIKWIKKDIQFILADHPDMMFPLSCEPSALVNATLTIDPLKKDFSDKKKDLINYKFGYIQFSPSRTLFFWNKNTILHKEIFLGEFEDRDMEYFEKKAQDSGLLKGKNMNIIEDRLYLLLIDSFRRFDTLASKKVYFFGNKNQLDYINYNPRINNTLLYKDFISRDYNSRKTIQNIAKKTSFFLEDKRSLAHFFQMNKIEYIEYDEKIHYKYIQDNSNIDTIFNTILNETINIEEAKKGEDKLKLMDLFIKKYFH